MHSAVPLCLKLELLIHISWFLWSPSKYNFETQRAMPIRLAAGLEKQTLSTFVKIKIACLLYPYVCRLNRLMLQYFHKYISIMCKVEMDMEKTSNGRNQDNRLTVDFVELLVCTIEFLVFAFFWIPTELSRRVSVSSNMSKSESSEEQLNAFKPFGLC